MKRSYPWFVVILLLASVGPVFAQVSKEAKSEKQAVATEARAVRQDPGSFNTDVYRLLFVLTEMEDGRKLNSREYSMSVVNDNTGRLRLTTRVPVNVASGQAPQIQYMDVGLSLDCHVTSWGEGVKLDATINVSSFAIPEQAEGKVLNPVTREQRSNVQTIAAPGKPVLLSSIDDLSSKKRYQVEVTASKMR